MSRNVFGVQMHQEVFERLIEQLRLEIKRLQGFETIVETGRKRCIVQNKKKESEYKESKKLRICSSVDNLRSKNRPTFTSIGDLQPVQRVML